MPTTSRPSSRALALPLVLLVLATIPRASRLAAQGMPFPDYDLRAECGSGLTGAEGTQVNLPGSVVLTSTPFAGQVADDGAQAWSLSLRPIGPARITSATTVGTAGAEVPAGLRQNGFEITQLTTGAGNEGVVSAVLLSFTERITLPITGDSVLLRYVLTVTIPARDCAVVGVEFHDGLQGAGRPVANNVTYAALTRRDDGGRDDIDADVEQDCSVLVCSDLARRFQRGNCDSAQNINLTDAVYLLNWLFRGGPSPSCIDACDTNDDAQTNLTDAVYLLLHLFQGGPAPPAPYPGCGLDPTPDGIACATGVPACAI